MGCRAGREAAAPAVARRAWERAPAGVGVPASSELEITTAKFLTSCWLGTVRPCCCHVTSSTNQLQNTRGRAVPERCGVMSAFEELGVSPELIRACDALGWTLPTPVQAEAVPLILGGGDVMVGASSSLPRARRALQYASPSRGFYALLHGAHADAPQRRRPGAARQAPLPCLCCKSCTRPSQGRRGQAAAAPS